MPVTNWGAAVCAVLERARIPQSALVRKFGQDPLKNRATVNRYLRNERTPDAAAVLRLNRLTEQLVSGNEGIPGNVNIRKYLDAEAMMAGLLGARAFGPAGPLALTEVIDGAVTTLECLGAGILRENWLGRFIEAAQAEIPEKQVSRLLVDLNRIHGRLLLDAIGGRVPAATGYNAVRDILTKYALSSLLKEDTQPADAVEQLTLEIRETLMMVVGPDVTALERFAAERKLLRTALAFVEQILQPRQGMYQRALADMLLAIDEPTLKRGQKGTK